MCDILYQDEDLLAVNKPENVLCVPGLSHSVNVYDQVRALFPNVRVVHRLDMATSGIMLFALNHASQKSLGLQFERRQILKHYSALVVGTVKPECGEVVMPLLCDWPNRPKQKVDWIAGKSAHTWFQVVDRAESYTHLLLSPLTGRSHQLRVHCQQLGHPIVGDSLYNPLCDSDRLMLHAQSIVFQHPRHGTPVRIHSDAPFAPKSASNFFSSAVICR